MPIPDFDRNGLLPAGVFDCTLAEIRIRFGWNDRRMTLFNNLAAFIENEVRPSFPDPWYCDGGFVTDKDIPQDIDVVLDLSAAPNDRKCRGLEFMNREQPRLFSQYRVDFWVNLPGGNDFLCSFNRLVSRPLDLRGSILITLKEY